MNHLTFGEGYVCWNIFPSAGNIERLSIPHAISRMLICIFVTQYTSCIDPITLLIGGGGRGGGEDKDTEIKKEFTGLEG